MELDKVYENGQRRALKEAYDRLKVMLNTSIDNEHFFEQLDDFIDELRRIDVCERYFIEQRQ